MEITPPQLGFTISSRNSHTASLEGGEKGNGNLAERDPPGRKVRHVILLFTETNSAQSDACYSYSKVLTSPAVICFLQETRLKEGIVRLQPQEEPLRSELLSGKFTVLVREYLCAICPCAFTVISSTFSIAL